MPLTRKIKHGGRNSAHQAALVVQLLSPRSLMKEGRPTHECVEADEVTEAMLPVRAPSSCRLYLYLYRYLFLSLVLYLTRAGSRGVGKGLVDISPDVTVVIVQR